MIGPVRLREVLLAHPFPGAVIADTCAFILGGAEWHYDGAMWRIGDRTIPVAFPAYGNIDDGDRAHAEIRRVLALLDEPESKPAPARMEPGHLYGELLHSPFPGAVDLRLDKMGLHFTVGGVAVRFDGAAFYAPRYHVRSTLPHPSATNSQGVHAEIHRVLAIVMGAGEPDEIDRRKDVEAQLAEMTDAHAVVSQRLVGAQREVADLEQQRDEYQAAVEVQRTRANVNHTRADKAEARVKRLLRQRRAAHAVLDEAGVACAVGDHPNLNLTLRVRAAVKGSYTTKDERGDLDPLLSRHNAPVKIGDRTLSPAERAAFVIRRLTRAAQNARAEAAALRAEQEEIAEALGDTPSYAEHADGSLVGLNLAERVRARLT